MNDLKRSMITARFVHGNYQFQRSQPSMGISKPGFLHQYTDALGSSPALASFPFGSM